LSDQLAKSFDRYLFLEVERDILARRRLIRSGWKDFIDSDRPETNSPAVMAAEAIIYMGVRDGCWSHEPKLVIAALAFLKKHYGYEPQVSLAELGQVLRETPVVENKIRNWCLRAFPTPG
jgi:hypothetical protein